MIRRTHAVTCLQKKEQFQADVTKWGKSYMNNNKKKIKKKNSKQEVFKIYSNYIPIR